ncbi:MAG: heavy metal-binding domain-containing protein [Gammaproteobacteria bacterium]|nr:heavy metal-binding domain-containing protein [Gammaproteobacteria bacterium]
MTKDKILMTTTSSVEGEVVKAYLGLVVGSSEHANTALKNLQGEAEAMGADAVIGIRICALGFGDHINGEFRCDVIGTAVKLK